MAKCYAGCRGSDRTRVKEAHRLGSVSAEGFAQTYKTFAKCVVHADGSGNVRVEQNGKVIREFQWGSEADLEPKETLPSVTYDEVEVD